MKYRQSNKRFRNKSDTTVRIKNVRTRERKWAVGMTKAIMSSGKYRSQTEPKTVDVGMSPQTELQGIREVSYRRI